jgi:hypothetical protein
MADQMKNDGHVWDNKKTNRSNAWKMATLARWTSETIRRDTKKDWSGKYYGT